MPPWIESMEQRRRRSTRNLPESSSSSGSWSVRSVMYSSSGASGSSGSFSNSFSISPVAVSSTPVSRLRWMFGALTLLTVLSRAEAVCDPDRWWNLEREECDPCTVCGEQQLVLRPCQEYMDTVCGTIGDLDMDLAQLARTEARHEQRHWKEERRKDGSDGPQQHRSHQHHANQQHPHPGTARKHENTEEILWDWQAASLLLAIIGCLMFFFAAAIIALNQTRQWKRIEKHFDADMEALSAQLMNHLSSMQQLENGSIFLDDVLGGDQRRFHRGGGERSGDSVSSTSALLGGHHHHHHHHPIEVRCVYLDQLLDGKNCIQSQGPGNLYIEETNNTPNVDRGTTAAAAVPQPPCHFPNGGSPLNRVRLY